MMLNFNTGKKRQRYLYILIAWCMYQQPVFAQFDAQLSQYMFNIPTYNPAAISENGLMNIAGQHRIQWVGMPGAPQTTYFNFNTSLLKKPLTTQAVGLKFLMDNIGAFRHQSAYLQYAYKKNVGKNRWSIGADVGFVSTSFISDSIKNTKINSPFHDFLGDEAIPQTDETGIAMDLSIGAFYTTPTYYIGLSYVHLNSPKIKINDEKTTLKVKGTMYATGGYDIPLPMPKMVLKSSALLKTDFTTWQAELSARVAYDSKYWGGISYRYQDAVVIFAGVDIAEGVHIGYAYDLPTGKLITVSSGSHEILLKYSFLLDLNKNKNRYKSIRLL